MQDLPLETELEECREKARRLARQNRAILLSNRRLCGTIDQLAERLAELMSAPAIEQEAHTREDYRIACEEVYQIVRQAQERYDDTYGRPKRGGAGERPPDPS